MDNQLNIFDFLEPVEEHESDYCEGCIFYREKCMYTKESKTDFCIEGKKKLKINDHIFSVSGNKITNLTITDHKGSSPNYFDCIDRKGQKVHVNILTIREWWDVSLELAKKCKFFEETTRKTKTLGEELREQGWINIHDREPSAPGMYEMYVVQLNRKVKNEYKGDHIWKALKCGYEASWWRELPVCKYSNHTCNKEVLHALAKDINPFCPGVCCRFCNTEFCGVRCNGSIGPEEKTVPEECIHCEYISKEYDIYGNESIDVNHCGIDGHPTNNKKNKPNNKCKKAQAELEEVILVDVRTIMDYGYCPRCNNYLEDLIEMCPTCKKPLDWSRWKLFNKESADD